MKFTLHVFMAAGFGVPLSWESPAYEKLKPPHRLPFRDAVNAMLDNLLTILLVPKKLLMLPIKHLRQAELGYSEFASHMWDLIDSAKRLGKTDEQNLLTVLVKHAAQEKAQEGYLQDQEILGNTFAFLIAGHETTYIYPIFMAEDRAHTLLYGFLMLALHPLVQNTMLEEIQRNIGDRNPTYDDNANLVYPLCVMFETLRLFPAVVSVPKYTQDEVMLLRKFHIPKNITLSYDPVHLHYNPEYWGDDVQTFNPSRFDGRKLDFGNEIARNGTEKIKMPVRGSFIPFSEGPRTCLGIYYLAIH